MNTAHSTFTFDIIFPLIARAIEHQSPSTFVSSTKITEWLLKDADGHKLVVAAQRKRRKKASLERVAGNMTGFFSQRWTMEDEKWKPLFELFERRQDGPRWSYKSIAGAREVDVILEGAVVQRSVNVYERSSLARLKCIARYGTKCHICGFSFGVKYGKTFDGFILVHHLHPLGEIGEKHAVDPIKDLRPVCANCHIILHTRTPAYSIDELESFLHSSRKGQHAKGK